MTEGEQPSPIMIFKSGGRRWQIDVLYLFKPFVGGEPITTTTINRALRETAVEYFEPASDAGQQELERYKYFDVETGERLLDMETETFGFRPTSGDLVKALAEGYRYYQIESKLREGYRVIRQFSGPAVIFINKSPNSSIGRKFVDPAKAKRFQDQNPNLERETPADENS